jgi:chorismate dehydratase
MLEKKGMDKIRISAVKYANTYPFIYGLSESGFDKKAIIETDHPADCAAKLVSGSVDIGLIPVAALPDLREYHLLSDYCIGAKGDVRTVMLLSNTSFEEINTIYLDYRSRSSVNLIRVIAKKFWKREFVWKNTNAGFDFVNIRKNEGVVLIGDQCFEFESRYSNRIDLARTWLDYTGLPFVFACWTANKLLDTSFLEEFNAALATGVHNIDAVTAKFGNSGTIKGDDLKKYLTENIDYEFNAEKRKGLSLFLDFLSRL